MNFTGHGTHNFNQITEFLMDIPLFRGLDPAALDYISRELKPFQVQVREELIREGEPGDALFVVAGGRLEAVKSKENQVLGEIRPGEIVGETALLTGEPRGATVRAVEDSHGYRLTRERFLGILEEHPTELRVVADLVARRAVRSDREAYRPSQEEIVSFMREIELFSTLNETALAELAPRLQWFTVPRGDVLIRQGETGDALFVVVSGRLRFEIRDSRESLIRSGTIQPGEVVGEMSLLTEDVRAATVVASRDSGLLQLSAAAWNQLMTDHPRVVLSVTRLLAQRLQEQSRRRRTTRSETVALIPLHRTIDSDRFGDQLLKAIERVSTARLLTRRMAERASVLSNDSGNGSGDGSARHRQWVRREELRHGQVLLQGIYGDDSWNRMCVQHADRVYLLADPSQASDLTPFELRHLGGSRSSEVLPREIVFFTSTQSPIATGTVARFLATRVHTRHHHVRDMSENDIERISRFATNTTVGIALGGGGARGLAHIGAIRALREAHIPIDVVVGTSIGALVGAVAAQEFSIQEMIDAAWRRLVQDRPFRDPAVPVVSMIKGRRLTSGLQDFFGDTIIEELPISYSAVATDLTTRDVAVISSGPIWKAVRTSTSIPGLMPPVYDQGRLLVDGGLLNNAPADVASARGADSVILLDVSGNTTRSGDEYREAFSGVDQGSAPSLMSYLRRGRKSGTRWPGLGETLMNSFMVGSDRQTRENSRTADCFLRLPVDSYTMLDFQSLHELVQLGYEETVKHVEDWKPRLVPGPPVA